MFKTHEFRYGGCKTLYTVCIEIKERKRTAYNRTNVAMFCYLFSKLKKKNFC